MLAQLRQVPSEIPLSVFSPIGTERPMPCVYWMHGGGMVMGDRLSQIDIPLEWLVTLGVVVAGISAAGVTLMARDLGGPAIAAQLLSCPMLDHRNNTTSSRQFSGVPGVWTAEMNEFGWRSVLGGNAAVSPYVSPATAGDLSGLPATYVDYAARIWAAGGQAELHVWPGGCHGFDALFPRTRLSAIARRTRTAWLAGVLGTVARNVHENGSSEHAVAAR